MAFDKEPSPEPAPTLKEQALNAYRKFVEAGVTSPDDLSLDDPEVQRANELYYAWIAQQDAIAEADPTQHHRINYEKTTFYLDAGFTDPHYLLDVEESLGLDLDDIEAEEHNLALKILNRIKEIEGKIPDEWYEGS